MMRSFWIFWTKRRVAAFWVCYFATHCSTTKFENYTSKFSDLCVSDLLFLNGTRSVRRWSHRSFADLDLCLGLSKLITRKRNHPGCFDGKWWISNSQSDVFSVPSVLVAILSLITSTALSVRCTFLWESLYVTGERRNVFVTLVKMATTAAQMMTRMTRAKWTQRPRTATWSRWAALRVLGPEAPGAWLLLPPPPPHRPAQRDPRLSSREQRSMANEVAAVCSCTTAPLWRHICRHQRHHPLPLLPPQIMWPPPLFLRLDFPVRGAASRPCRRSRLRGRGSVTR